MQLSVSVGDAALHAGDQCSSVLFQVMQLCV